MRGIVDMINNKFPGDLDKVFEEAAVVNPTCKDALKKFWERDCQRQQKKDMINFFEDQVKCQTGSKQNRWNTITYRIALAISTRSEAAYQALKDFNILQLPSMDTLRRKTKKYNSPPGIDFQYLKEQAIKYEAFRAEKKAKGEMEPIGEGILIFDEVKVIEQVIWNSKSHTFSGIAMTEEEFPNLHDVFANITKRSPSAAQYILQFLWRDMSSDFDVIGPYFSSPFSVNISFILTNLYETIRVFEQFNFKIIGLVCDGASSNLSLIKLTVGVQGAFELTKENIEYNFEICPKFKHPHADGRDIYWIICPTHQLKNMVGQLYASRQEGPKEFFRNDVKFGWLDIEEMFKREEERVKWGQLRYVPRLLKSYIIRDAWTKLNVKPSKIMQQEQVLMELFAHYNNETASAESRSSAFETYKYLKACNQLFEHGLLSKTKMENESSENIQSIKTGYKYFESWASELLVGDPQFQLTKNTQALFISWQTWDLLRIAVFGMEFLAKDFISRNPKYFINPSRINGSAVESLFSQMKYSSGSKLSSVNYSYARRSLLTRRNISGHHAGNKEYRDAPLYITIVDF